MPTLSDLTQETRRLLKAGDDTTMLERPRLWSVIEDADHSYETSMVLLGFLEDGFVS
jgi:hypothetical protein